MEFTIRDATEADAEIVLHQRLRMFEDMAMGSAAERDAIRISTRSFLREAFRSGLYRGWLAVNTDGMVVAGGGVILSPWPPSVLDGKPQRPYIINMYTEPEFRRLGLAKLIFSRILDFLRSEGFASVRLNASAMGRSVYESIGFVASNEMLLHLD